MNSACLHTTTFGLIDPRLEMGWCLIDRLAS
jgi:hypothetical protein